MNKRKQFILWFNQLGIHEVPLVGGKNASLGEMYQNLTNKGVAVPNGFAVTAYAYQYLLKKAGVQSQIKSILRGLNTHDVRNLAQRGQKVRELLLHLEFPTELKKAIVDAYKKMCKMYGPRTDVAVRSSATAEDLPDASFAGQQETYLNIRGEQHLLEACRKCFASLFTNRAISYREDRGFDHFKVSLSIGVQKMVRSDKASSGVMFSIDTESGFRNAVFITGSWGLGENVVQGAVNPDQFYVFKPTLEKGFEPILSRKVGSKRFKMVYDEEGIKSTTKNIKCSRNERRSFVLSDNEILQLAKWAVIIEEHYSTKRKKFTPMDMEWAKDGKTGKLFIVQARPETVQSQKNVNVLEKYSLKQKGHPLVDGLSVGDKIGQGVVNVIKSVKNITKFSKGQVLVTDMTDPDWEPIMKIASAIVTNRGGRTCFDGDTKIITNRGFKSLKQIHDDGFDGLQTLSCNQKTGKMEWKPILASMKKRSKRMTVSVSQSGRIKDNTVTLTPDHRMINIRNSALVKTEIQDMISHKEMLCVSQRIPDLQESSWMQQRLAYLLGGIATDGHIYRSKTHGEVQFIQKQTPEKEEFISYMNECMTSAYGKSFVPYEKAVSSGTIRGKQVRGQATAYRLYSKQIAYDMHEQEQQLVTTLLHGDKQLSYHFLAGVIDGEGSFYNNRIQVYISNEHLLQAVITACLKIGSFPQVTKNRTISNVQLVEKIDDILGYTKRVKGKSRSRIIKSRFFSSRQVLSDNVVGQHKLRKKNNLYISDEDLQSLKDEKTKLLVESDLRMHRVIDTGERDSDDVYNITVAENHTYVVFTKRYTPVVVCNCHAAIIAREMGIPCVVGTETGTTVLKNNQQVTVDCSQGEQGIVYKGYLRYELKRINLKHLKKPKTKIMMNVGNPEQAFDVSFLPNEGVGLAREEFVINSYVRIHPLALLQYPRLSDHHAKEQIKNLTEGYADKGQYFIDKLSQGVSMIAAAFYPKDVIVRLSDFKSNEYANLIGGNEFEPVEDNPMIGWRGASRYYSKNYEKAFRLECLALRKVRDEMGLTNVKVMIPICRTVEEGKKVIALMSKYGLKRGKNGLEVYVMCEIPSNVILAEQFSDIFDGFSIGSNDLTQLTLGLDRDSELVSHLYNERNDAVKAMISSVIKVAKRRGKKIGICGDGPSSFPDFAQFLVKEGIDSLSLTPDAIVGTTVVVSKLEERLRRRRKSR